MNLWDIVEKVKNHSDKFDLIIPKGIDDLPSDMYYIVKIIRFFPNKEKCSRQYIWQTRFKTKNPKLTKVLLDNFESKMRIKIAEL
jgi:hypothetical protein